MAGTGPPSAPQQILSEKDNHDGITEDVFVDAMNKFRLANAKNLIISHLNINGLRNEFIDISFLLQENILDILFLTETKLDKIFLNAQFFRIRL